MRKSTVFFISATESLKICVPKFSKVYFSWKKLSFYNCTLQNMKEIKTETIPATVIIMLVEENWRLII